MQRSGSSSSSSAGVTRAAAVRRDTTSKRRRASLSIDEARATLAASKKLYYRIGEVSALTGVKAHVLRYWETEFRWMAPPKSRSKQRLYRKRDIELVWLLKQLLWEQRYTIAGARQRIQELGLDEALARSADASIVASDGDGLDESADRIAASERTSGIDGHVLDASLGRSPIGQSPLGRPQSGSGAAEFDWLALRGAIESMQTELLALRGSLLQEA